MLDIGFRIIMYTFFFGSIGIVCYYLLKPNIRYMQLRYERIQKHDIYQSMILRVARFLELSVGKSNLITVYIFIVGLITLYFMIFIGLLLNGYKFIVAVLLPLVIVMLIYYVLYLLGYRNKVLITHEGIVLVQELLNNYKIYNKNIYEGIERTANTLTVEQAPLSKKMMKNLSYRIRQARNDNVVKEALNRMFYVMDVSWAYSLSILIEKAVLDGLDIEDSLKDILEDLEELESVKEDLKDEIHEARSMLMYIAPIMILLTFFIMTKMFGFTMAEYFKYQLGEGLLYLLGIVILGLIAIGLYLYVTKPKNDF